MLQVLACKGLKIKVLYPWLVEVLYGVNEQYAVQRQWKRFKVNLRIKISLVRDGEHILLYGQGSDVSEGGMGAYIPTELAVGDVVDLELQFPYTKDSVPIKSVVRNRSGFRYGLETVQIDPQSRELLVRSLKALSLVQH